VVDGYGFVFGFQDTDEGLLLAQDSWGEKRELLLGQLPGSLGSRDRDGDVLFGLGRKKAVFFSMIPDEEKFHEARVF
jgi:hypothetical protein